MTETTQTFSLGEQLKNARQALNLSIAEVAEKTNLKKTHLESLEDDIFILPNVPPAFVRGYVRSYVRFLRLPEELVNSANYGEVTIPKQPVKAAAIPVNQNQKSQRRWLKTLTWLVLLATIGMTLTWWWQEYQKDQVSNQQFVNANLNSVSTDSATTQNSVVVPATESVAVNVQNVQSAEPVPSTSTTQVEVATAEPANVETVVETPTTPVVEMPKVEEQPVAVEVAQPQVTQEVVVQMPVQQPELQVVQVVEPVNVLQQIETAVEQPKAEESNETQSTIVGDAELRIEITNAQSWITVRGEKNKKLAEKLYSAGEVLTFSDNAQYRLTVGAPANVKIYYKGEQVPLKVDGRVARFKLPLAN